MRSLSSAARVRNRGFTLVEVVVASFILAVGLGGILLICSNGLRAARMLDRVHVDAGSLATMLSLTNRLEEGVDSGDFGDLHPGYQWTREIRLVGTNGLFQVDFVVTSGVVADESRLSILLFRPASTQGVGR